MRKRAQASSPYPTSRRRLEAILASLKEPGRPKKKDEEDKGAVRHPKRGTNNTEYIHARLKDRAMRTAAGWLVDPEDVERYKKRMCVEKKWG